MNRITLLDPIGEIEAEVLSLAPGLQTIQGRRIGILFNNKQNRGERLLKALAINLEAVGIADVLVLSKASRARAAEPEILKQLATSADAVLSGVAD